MILTSDQFLAALRGPQVFAVQATAYPPNGNPVDLPVVDGSVVIDRTADHRRSLSLTLAPIYPSGHALEGQPVYPDTPSDPVNVYGTEIVVWRGLRYASNAEELVQLGFFRVEDASLDTSGGGVVITGWDRSRQVLDQRFLKPRKMASQLAVNLIKTLIREVYPTAIFDVQTADTTTIPKHVVDRDRWPEVQRLAQVIGCEVFPTETGMWRIQDTPDPSVTNPVWDVDAGPSGVLIGLGDTVTREGAPNIVVTLGESFNGRDGPVVIRSDSSVGRGTWSSSTAYSVGDGVQQGSTAYVATQAGTNHQPSTSPSFWDPAGPGIVDMANHEVVENQQVSFHTGGTLPDPLTQGTTYYVHSVIDADSFHISATRSGSSIATTASTTPNAAITMDIQGLPITSAFPHGYDTNPKSPTYYLGAYGEVARFYSSGHIRTQSQANRVADAQLADHLGASRTINFRSVPNPALDAGDVVRVTRPDGSVETHMIDAITIPLASSGEMTGETRALDWSAA